MAMAILCSSTVLLSFSRRQLSLRWPRYLHTPPLPGAGEKSRCVSVTEEILTPSIPSPQPQEGEGGRGARFGGVSFGIRLVCVSAILVQLWAPKIGPPTRPEPPLRESQRNRQVYSRETNIPGTFLVKAGGLSPQLLAAGAGAASAGPRLLSVPSGPGRQSLAGEHPASYAAGTHTAMRPG